MSNGINGTTILRSSASAKNVSPEVTNTGTHTKLGPTRRTVFVQVGTGVRPSNNANATIDRKVQLGKPKAPDRRILTGHVPQLDTDQLMLCRFILSSELERISTAGSTANPELERTITSIDLALEAQSQALEAQALEAQSEETDETQQRRPVARPRPNRIAVDGRQTTGRARQPPGGFAPRRVQRPAAPPEPAGDVAE